MLGLLVLLPLYFEAVRLPTLSPLDTGLALVPFGLGGLVGTMGATLLYRAIGPRRVVCLGAALAAISAWLLAQTIQPTASASQLVVAMQNQTPLPAVAGPEAVRWGLFLVGLSFTVMLTSVQTLALEALKGEALAKASSLFLSTRQIFYAVGVAIVTTLFVERTQTRAVELIKGAGIDLSTPGGVAARLTIESQITTQAGTWAVQSIFWLIFFGSLGLIALALLLPGRKRRSSTEQAEKAHYTGSPLQ
jgi:predicted MFS family arabinose efflux permease